MLVDLCRDHNDIPNILLRVLYQVPNTNFLYRNEVGPFCLISPALIPCSMLFITAFYEYFRPYRGVLILHT